jgi:hypothetical protein
MRCVCCNQALEEGNLRRWQAQWPPCGRLADQLNIPPQSDMAIFLHVASRMSPPSLFQLRAEVGPAERPQGVLAERPPGPFGSGLRPMDSIWCV